MKHTTDTRRDYDRIVDLCERFGTCHGRTYTLNYTDGGGIPYRLIAEERRAGAYYVTAGVPTMHGTFFAFGATPEHVINWSPAISQLLDAIEAHHLNDGADVIREARDLIPAVDEESDPLGQGYVDAYHDDLAAKYGPAGGVYRHFIKNDPTP